MKQPFSKRKDEFMKITDEIPGWNEWADKAF